MKGDTPNVIAVTSGGTVSECAKMNSHSLEIALRALRVINMLMLRYLSKNWYLSVPFNARQVPLATAFSGSSATRN